MWNRWGISYLAKLFGSLLFVTVFTVYLYACVIPEVWMYTGKHSQVRFLPKEEFVQIFDRKQPYASTANITVHFMTPFFRKWSVIDYFVDSANHDTRCPYNCVYTKDDTGIGPADVLVYHAYDVDFKYFPKSRHQDQIWIIHSGESPWKIYKHMADYNSVFNWTSFVRFDSDVIWRYGKLVKRTRSDVILDYRTFKPRSKSAYWMASNCGTLTARDNYVDELKMYIDVDVYGKCLPDAKTCNKTTLDCDGSKYNFYLAFENAVCRNYITEKFWRSLKLGVIPVVMGDSSSYQQIAPPNSYIDVSNFTSPQRLAEYLHQVQNNVTLYQSYLKWRTVYKTEESWSCDLCESLHKWDGRHQVYRDLSGWHNQDYCPTWTIWSVSIIVNLLPLVCYQSSRYRINHNFS